ncbi:lipoprotein [Rosenbergiella sp. S61]|uniref:Lipoprotein n=1 Tax=Rosenbergiella gaditana TaxID=2726987 RepID=A0ABS5STD8_9GAMM|nr:lipoprotein [Rosenbergiella gaditana]MBT0723355.1 lipoprotein [Rosenbergiella gaditana]
MRKCFSIMVICCSVLLAGCDHLASYSLSEQEINQSLSKHAAFEKDIGINGLANAHITLDTLHTEIGRAVDNQVVLSGHAKVDFASLFGQQKADLNLKMSAVPVFNREQGAVYLHDITILDAQAQPQKVQGVVESLKPLLATSLRDYFNQQPAWILSSDRSKAESLAKKYATGIEVKPGELVIPLAP